MLSNVRTAKGNMVNNDIRVVKRLEKGDYVYASFARIDRSSDMIEGWLQKVSDESILIRERNPKDGPKVEYGLWQMTSLVCPKKDVSFYRQEDVFLRIDRLSRML